MTQEEYDTLRKKTSKYSELNQQLKVIDMNIFMLESYPQKLLKISLDDSRELPLLDNILVEDKVSISQNIVKSLTEIREKISLEIEKI